MRRGNGATVSETPGISLGFVSERFWKSFWEIRGSFMNRLKIISILSIAASSSLFGQEFQKPPATHGTAFAKTSQTKNAAILNASNFTFWLNANGQGANPPNQAYSGGVFPRGTVPLIFADGGIWAAKCYLDAAHSQPAPLQLIRVGGNTYNVGNAVGWIKGTGANAVAASTSDSKARIYRIRRDWSIMTVEELKRDAAENNLMAISDVTDADAATVEAQYGADWSQWPAGPTNDQTIPNLGAPYIERNGIPGYQRPPWIGYNFAVDSLISAHYDEPGVAEDPNSPATQVVWTVCNDLTRGNMIGFEGSEPMGLEVQITLWAYDINGPVSNAFFKRIRIINKGGAVVNASTGAKGSLWLDSLFIGNWVDGDLGGAGDDLLGCDTTRAFAFSYNGFAADAAFAPINFPPPAFGYTLLWGPTAPSLSSDSAVFNFRRIPGKKNLGMTSYEPKGSGMATFSDPTFNYTGALSWWKWIRGYRPGPVETPDLLYPFPPGIEPTKFPLSGDPVTRQGFLDGRGDESSPPPGDRRFTLSSGPTTLAPGDTQEVVYAIVGGLGADNISSISVLKHNVDATRQLARSHFTLPQLQGGPNAAVVELNREIVLDWGSDPEKVRTIEDHATTNGYAFEGYNVYQLSSPNVETAARVRIATFDRANDVGIITETTYDPNYRAFLPTVLQTGTNSGIRRSIRITKDALNNNAALHNGTEYYFAVTAYNYSAYPNVYPAIENRIVPVRAIPRIPFGVGGQMQAGDSVTVSHAQGSGSGRVAVAVVNPLTSTGATYEIRFDTSGGSTTWSLRNVTENRTVVSSQPLYLGPDDPPTVEGGVNLLVAGPNDANDVYSYSLTSVQTGTEVQKASVGRVNVFPNPYYADEVQRGTTSRAVVTFSNLPQRATIRIFNLAGHLVRILHKDNTSQYFDWDLTNEDNWQVGSGMYLCYIEMPDIGEKKILKLAVIQGQLYPTYKSHNAGPMR
ncbi:MAG: T9SS type A sorting domain-containing protein [Bacteroidota bacterium]